jgi:hypothetical protein
MGFYILDGMEYPCVEYTLSQETAGYSYPIHSKDPYFDENGDGTFSLSRKYIVVSKEEKTDYIYLDSQYELQNHTIVRAKRNGFLIREDDENYEYDSINEIQVYDPMYNNPWDLTTHGKRTHKHDVISWNWDYSGGIMAESIFDEFFEEPSIYDEDYACMSYKWDIDQLNQNTFGYFVRYDQLEMDTIHILW